MPRPRAAPAHPARALRAALRRGWRPGGLWRLGTARGSVCYRVLRADAPSPSRRPALVVGLHGFGSDERQVATMLALDVPGPVVYLAPRGPLAEGRGRSWFALRLGAGGAPEAEPQSRAAAADAVRAFGAAAARAWGADPERVALVGYSQGGALALEVAHRPGPFAAVAALAGGAGLVGPPAAPVFVGVGTRDPFGPTPVERARLAALRGVTVCEAEAGHVVTASQREALGAWLARRLR